MSKPMAMSGQPIKAQVQRVSGEPLEKIGIIMFHKNNYFRDELSSDLNLSSPSYGFLFFFRCPAKRVTVSNWMSG